MSRLSTLPLVLAISLITVACAATTDSTDEDVASGTDQAMSKTIHTTYGVTEFGGPGDYQQMACGLSSKTAQTSHPYYVASSQRYGCHVHLKIETSAGRCVVASTEDAGPASFVETDAKVPVLDSSPAVVKALFPGTGGLGWSDLRAHPGKYDVTVTQTDLPLGPC